MTVYLFPGQGSQSLGMGHHLFDAYPEEMAVAEDILGYSLRELCLSDPKCVLSRTDYTQPALYVVNALTYREHLQKHNQRQRPHADAEVRFFAGHSLGEYNALEAAGVFSFETGLRIVKKRGELMASAPRGQMAAVTGIAASVVADILLRGGFESVDIANYNAPRQCVISGPLDACEGLMESLAKAGGRYHPLAVSGAFHSRYLAQEQTEFRAFLSAIAFQTPHSQVVSNVTARPHSADEIGALLVEQLVKPVLWMESIEYLLAQGMTEFVEAGPGNVLKGLLKPIRHGLEARQDPRQLPPEAKTAGVEPDAAVRVVEAKRSEPTFSFTAESLGSQQFKQRFNLKYAYALGAMYQGIASVQLVSRAARAGLLSFFGTGGLALPQIEQVVDTLQEALGADAPYGMNLMPGKREAETIRLYLDKKVQLIEASAYTSISAPLVLYRLSGLARSPSGLIQCRNRILAKLSRPEIAEAFMSPPPAAMVQRLLNDGLISRQQADLAQKVPMADAVCVEADSGGHTDRAVLSNVLPVIKAMAELMRRRHDYQDDIYTGAAGGIGNPGAVISAFMLGADFVMTGSVNQCSVEANISDAVKDALQGMNVQDTDYVPAGDMFEAGSLIQVLKKGVLFPANAKKLFEIYKKHGSLESLDEKTRELLQRRIFKRSLEDVYHLVKQHHSGHEIEKAEASPKHKMALVFRWYFQHTTQLALTGDPQGKLDYQIQTGSALGAFNHWVQGTELEDWRNRHVDRVAYRLMTSAAELLGARMAQALGERG